MWAYTLLKCNLIILKKLRGLCVSIKGHKIGVFSVQDTAKVIKD